MLDIINSLSIGLLTGPIFLITGLITWKFPPKKINHLYGYRTINSMKNQQNWEVAQLQSSKLLVLFGIVLTAISTLLLVLEIDIVNSIIIETIVLLGSVIALFILVERKIK